MVKREEVDLSCTKESTEEVGLYEEMRSGTWEEELSIAEGSALGRQEEGDYHGLAGNWILTGEESLNDNLMLRNGKKKEDRLWRSHGRRKDTKSTRNAAGIPRVKRELEVAFEQLTAHKFGV